MPFHVFTNNVCLILFDIQGSLGILAFGVSFFRKCKTFSDGQKDQLLKEMNGLNLTKYIGELAQEWLQNLTESPDLCLRKRKVIFCTFS